eukprot:sb/3474160/
MLGLNPYRSSFPDVVSKIEQLQDRILGHQTIALRRTYELETLRGRVEAAGREVEDLNRENRRYDMKNRVLDQELLRLRRHGKRKSRRLSLDETVINSQYLNVDHHEPRKVSTADTVGIICIRIPYPNQPTQTLNDQSELVI